jgi:hypothetical protein
VFGLALTGCGSAQPQGTLNYFDRNGAPDRECYASVYHSGAYWLWQVAAPAPANQPWVQIPADCRYSIVPASGPTIDMTGVLDPMGCYGMDSGGSNLIFRAEFCASPPT